jgi:hypothetical protein
MARARSRLGRVLRVIAIVLASLVGLVAILVVALLATPPGRNFLATRVNAALAEQFAGTLVIERLGGAGPAGVSGVDVRVLDAESRRVLSAHGCRVDANVVGIVWSLVTKAAGDVLIELSAHCDHVEARLIDDGTGSPTIASAFGPRVETPETDDGPGPTIVLRSIELDHVWAHGALADTPLDVELQKLLANLRSDAGLYLGIERAGVIGRNLPTVRETRASLTGSLRLEPDSPDVQLGAELRGKTLDSDYTVSASLHGERLSGAVHVPKLSPVAVQALAPGVDLANGASLVADIEGPFDELSFAAVLTGPNGRAAARGILSTTERTELEARLALRDVALSRAVSGAPDGHVTLDAGVWLDLEDLKGVYWVDAGGSTLLGERLLRFALDGELDGTERGGLTLAGDLELAAQGIDATVAYSVRAADDTHVRAELAAKLDNPALLARPSSVFAQGTLDARFEYDVAQNRIEASATARLARVLVPGSVEAEQVVLDAGATGDIGAPALRATLDVERIEASGRAFEAVRLRAEGSPVKFRVAGSARDERSRPFELAAQLGVADGVHVESARVVQGEGRDALRVGVERATFLGSAIELRGLVIEGAGTARADLRYRNGLESLRFESNELDALRLARLAAVDLPLKKLTVSLSGEYSRAKKEGFARGTAQALVERAPAVTNTGKRAPALPVALTLDLATSEGTLSGKAEIDAAGTQVVLDADEVKTSSLGDIARAPFTTPGSMRLSATLDLASLSRAGLLAPLGVERAAGKLELEIFVPDASSAEGGAIALHVESRRLELVGQRQPTPQIADTEAAKQADPWVIRGIDLDVTLGAAFAERRAGLSGRLFDEHGTLLEARVESELPRGPVAQRAWLASLLDVPLRAEISVPERRFAKLPPAIRPATLEGSISGRVSASGTPRHPEIVATVETSKFRVQSERPGARQPVDANVTLEYKREGGSITGAAAVNRRPALRLDSRWKGDLALVPAALSSEQRSPVEGSLELELRRFPLAVAPALASRRIQGELDGKIQVEGFGRAPKIVADVRASRFAVDRIQPGDVMLRAKLEGNALEAGAELRAGASRAKVSWKGGVDWGARVAPATIQSRDLHAELRRFELGTIFPLVEGTVSELSGKLDADVHVTNAEQGRDLRGSVSLRDGVLQVPAIGQRFHAIEARATLANDQLSMPRLRARGITGAVSATAEARLRDLELVDAKARVEIKEDEKLPVTVEGVSLGDAWGVLGFRLARSPQGTTRMEANVERLHLVLPEVAPSSVQGFEPAQNVKVGVFRRDGEFSAIPMQPIKASDGEAGSGGGGETFLRIKLGNEVWVHQGEKFDVRFRGGLDVRLGEETRLEGKIELAGGSLDVSGKRFEIETGTITLAGPVETALVTATARWDSPAGYSVYADFSGTISDGKLELRSEPPLGRDEILSLLLFGTPDGNVGSGSGDNASTAASLAGDTAAAGLNQLLSRFTELDVSARIDTSTGSARPELVLQVTPRLTARVTRALGEPAPGQSPDRTFFTLELRLRRRWSLATIVGDQGGTALEIVWRLRY